MSSMNEIKSKALKEIESLNDGQSLEQLKAELLGKKGQITQLAQQMASLSLEDKKSFGKELNEVKDAITAALDNKRIQIKKIERDRALESERLDLTLEPRPQAHGKLHPISQTIEELVAIFGEMGFHVAEGPEIESDYYNFTALNMPESHPARQMQDTFYVHHTDDAGNPYVLRTHTSNVQIRGTLAEGAPIRIIAPGRTYRCDSDMTHSPMFHQVEGIVIEKKIHMGHLKGCLSDFCSAFFEISEVPLRFRPSYFPFTEPSAEVDIGCSRKSGNLKIGAGDSWLEILGSGMMHPQVIKNCGLDPDEWQGFAFGMGIERIAMLKYGIPDLREFYNGKLGWLDHYGFSPWQNPTLLRSLVA